MTLKKANKIVLFDIDHTIFNTISYRKNLYKNLAREIGVDVDNFSNAAKTAYDNLRKTTYYLDPPVFLKAILNQSKNPADIQKLEAVFWDNKLYESCIFPDVKETFSYLKKNNFTIGIFSTGHLAHQKIKIESLKKYLSTKHIYISPDKLKVVKDTFKIYKNYQTYLVDDYPQVLQNAKNHHKEIFTVFMKRQKKRPDLIIPDDFSPDATITNLKQLIDIIKTN